MMSSTASDLNVLDAMQRGAERVDCWLRADGWKEDEKRKVGSAVFAWLPAAAGGNVGSSDRTVWKLHAIIPVPPNDVFVTFTERMAEIIPPGVSYRTRELTAEQPWEEAGILVQRSITTSFVGGLVSPREYIDVLRDRMNIDDGAGRVVHRRDGLGLGAAHWPIGSGGEVRGINHHVAIVCSGASNGDTDLTYLVQTAANGWIPGWAVDSALVDEHLRPVLEGLCRVLGIAIPGTT